MSQLIRTHFQILNSYIRQLMADDFILKLGKNSRMPKQANHGARPCSSVMRRMRRRELIRRKWKHIGQDAQP